MSTNDAVARSITDKQLKRVFLEGAKTGLDEATQHCNTVMTTMMLVGDPLAVMLLLREQLAGAARETQTAIDELRELR